MRLREMTKGAQYMKEFIEKHGINYEDFRYMMCRENMMISGSSALYLYLKQEGEEPGFEPNDIDIWAYNNRYSKNAIQNIMEKYNYTIRENEDFDDYYDDPDERLQRIMSIDNYVSSDGFPIQVIYLSIDNVIKYIKDFDISCCSTWWNPFKETFQTMRPDLTKSKKMYIREDLSSTMSEKTEKRVNKYVSRGFTLISTPLQCERSKDPRVFSDTFDWKSLIEHDILTLENNLVKDYLLQSDWNIVLKAGDNYYGYNRKDLVNMMKLKKLHTSLFDDYICDTPLNQTFMYMFIDVFKSADYSIYELVPKYSVDINDKITKNMHDIKCYDVAGFEKGVTNNYIYAPPNPVKPPRILKRRSTDVSQARGLTIEIPPLEPLLFDDNNGDTN